MTRSLCSCLLISVLAPAIISAAYAQNVSDPWSDPATLVELARDWKDFDLPIAPADAVFATGDPNQRVLFNGRPWTGELSLVLALKDPNVGKLNRFWTLTGTELLSNYDGIGGNHHVDFEIVAEGRANVPVTRVTLSGHILYMNEPLAMAVQAQVRHQPELALSLLQLASKFETSGVFDLRAHAIPTTPPEPRRALATLAWSYWRTELIEPNTDRATILNRLERIMNSPLAPDSLENRHLINDLKQTLKTKSVPNDVIEARIYDLTNTERRKDWRQCDGYGNKESADPNDVDPRYRALWHMGFDAVPAMINHLDDGRLTRRAVCDEGGPTEQVARVSDVVSDILIDLSAGALAKTRSRGKGLGYGLEPIEVQVWWEAAKATGERKYLLEHAYPASVTSKQGRRPAALDSQNMREEIKATMRELESRMNRADAYMLRNSCTPRSHLLHVTFAKYPEDLPELFRRANEHCPQAPQRLLCELLAQSTVNPEIKSQLLLQIARNKSPEARYAAILVLARMKGPATCAIVADGISAIPLRWEAGVVDKMATKWTRLVTECDDPANWTLLEKMARRCDAGQRIEILWAMACCGVESDCSHRQRRLEFLGRFLNDIDFPDTSSGSIPSAGSVSPQLSVRNAAAHSIASILSITPQPLYNADETAWTDFRLRVRKAVEKEIKVP